jgi:6-phosphogluconate dehydrogenase
MEIGIIGLGRMGMNIGARLERRGHTAFGYDVSADKRPTAEDAGIKWRSSVEELGAALHQSRVIWIMVPAGQPVDDAISKILSSTEPGDIIIDGGNSYYKDSIRRAEELKEHGIKFLDCGTSGGIWGLVEGFCLMVGGDQEAYQLVEPILTALAPDGGCRLVGPSGAGHFVKMVHNGIEYGLLQAYGEGFEILHSSQFDLDLQSTAELWNRGSVIRSWLLELAAHAFASDPDLERIAGYVEDSGEGRWTVFEAIDKDVPAPVITLSLLTRLRSRQEESFSAKFIAALRHEFGGHRLHEEHIDPSKESS